MTARAERFIRIEQNGADLVVAVPAQRIRIKVHGAPLEVRKRIAAARSDVEVLAALPHPVFDALREALRPAGATS